MYLSCVDISNVSLNPNADPIGQNVCASSPRSIPTTTAGMTSSAELLTKLFTSGSKHVHMAQIDIDAQEVYEMDTHYPER